MFSPSAEWRCTRSSRQPVLRYQLYLYGVGGLCRAGQMDEMLSHVREICFMLFYFLLFSSSRAPCRWTRSCARCATSSTRRCALRLALASAPHAPSRLALPRLRRLTPLHASAPHAAIPSRTLTPPPLTPPHISAPQRTDGFDTSTDRKAKETFIEELLSKAAQRASESAGKEAPATIGALSRVPVMCRSPASL